MSSKPDPALMERHYAAMQVVKQLSEPERVALLSYVVAPTKAVIKAQKEKS